MELDRYIPRRDQVLRIIDACEGCTRSNKGMLHKPFMYVFVYLTILQKMG